MRMTVHRGVRLPGSIELSLDFIRELWPHLAESPPPSDQVLRLWLRKGCIAAVKRAKVPGETPVGETATRWAVTWGALVEALKAGTIPPAPGKPGPKSA